MNENDARVDEVLEKMANENEDLLKENECLKERVKKLESQITSQENYSRRLNLRLDGVKEEVGEDTEEVVRDIVRTKLKIPDFMSIDVCHRLGSRGQKDGQSQSQSRRNNKPRTILVRFTRLSDRQRVWASKKELKGTRMFLNEDYCIQTEKLRRQLYPCLKSALKDGAKCYMNSDRLVINGRSYTVETVPQKYKL